METTVKEPTKNTRTDLEMKRKVEGAISSDLLDKAKSVLKVVTGEKVMKQFNRNVNDNVKLDRFLSAEFRLPKAFAPETLDKTIKDLVEPSKHDHHGLVNIENQKTLLTLLEKGLIEAEIAAKKAWLATFKLNEEQERKAAETMSKYEKQLRGAISKAVASWRKVYGGD